MRKAVAVLGFAALMVFASVTAAPAIAIFSADGPGDGFGVLTCIGACAVVQISPIPAAWQNPATSGQPSAEWVSTAANHGTFASGVPNGTVTTFRYTFTAAIDSYLDLTTWADDTSGVTYDGITALFAQQPGPYPTCATAPIGCTPANGGVIDNMFITAGIHTIDFDFLQAGGDNTPYGLLFAGELTPTPEPATILLLGSALAAAGIASRRRLSQKSQQ